MMNPTQRVALSRQMGVRNRVKFLVGVLLASFGAVAQGAPQAGAGTELPTEVLRYADAVFYNANIVTVDPAFSTVEAIAVRDGKVLAVGTRDRMLKMAGPDTTKIDLGGKTVLPGFYEVHPVITNTPGGHGPRGPIHLGSQVIRFTDVPTGLKMIKEKAYAEDWKQSDGWALVTIERTKAAYELTKDLLDTVVPDRPLYLTLDNTMGILNSKGLERLPPQLFDMGIFKDEKTGQPNGHIRGWANGVLTYDIPPWPEGEGFEKLVAEQKFIFDLYNQRGVTTFGGRVNGLVTTVFKTLLDRNDLSVRVRVVSEMGRLNPHAESFFKRIGNIMDVGNEWFKIVGTTVGSIDGVARFGGILTTHAKRGEPEGAGAFAEFGENKWTDVVQSGEWEEKTEFRNFILAARYGWNVNDIHVIGDRGVDIVLEAMTEANKFTPLKGKRFGMVHGMMRRPDQMKKLANFGAKMSFTPKYLFSQKGTEIENLKTTYGADILHDIISVGTALKEGIHPVLESNEYVGDLPSWFFMMEPFVTRKNPTTGVVYGRDERLDRKDALRMTTVWAAEFYGDEKIAGSLEPGKVADFIIVDRDYLTIPEDDISEIQVLATLIGGKPVFDRLGLPLSPFKQSPAPAKQ